LLSDVYGDDNIPIFGVDTFYSNNNDGKISWSDFESGFVVVTDTKAKETRRKDWVTAPFQLSSSMNDDGDEEEEDTNDII